MGLGGSFSKSSSKTQATDIQAKEFRELRQGFANLIGGQFGNIQDFLSGDLQFQGDQVNLDQFRAPISIGEQSALDDLGLQAQGGVNEGLASDLVGRTLSGDFLSPGTNEGLADLIRLTNKEINASFDEEGLLQKALFSRAGQELPESSPFAQAASKLQVGRIDALRKNTAALSAQSFEAERDRQVQAVEQQRSQAGFEFNRQLEFLQASSLPRLIDEIGFDRAFQEFQSRLQGLSQALGIAFDITAPRPIQESRASSFSTSGSAGVTGGGGGSSGQ